MPEYETWMVSAKKEEREKKRIQGIDAEHNAKICECSVIASICERQHRSVT